MVFKLLNLFRKTVRSCKNNSQNTPLLSESKNKIHKSKGLSEKIVLQTNMDQSTLHMLYKELKKKLARQVIQELDQMERTHPYQRVICQNPLIMEVTKSGMLRIIMARVAQEGELLEGIVQSILEQDILSTQELMNLKEAVEFTVKMLMLIQKWMMTGGLEIVMGIISEELN
ncbi:accessory protein [Plecomyxo virus]|nr:accessory protein [Plecomyxo virus]